MYIKSKLLLINTFRYLVKTSPSKKRRAVTHGNVRRAAGSIPPLSTQTSINSQHHLLQHQSSVDTREDADGEEEKNMFTVRYKHSAHLHVLTCHRLPLKCRINSVFLPSLPVIQWGRPDLLPEALPPSDTAGSTPETAISSTSIKSALPHPQDNSKSVGVTLNNTPSKDQGNSSTSKR